MLSAGYSEMNTYISALHYERIIMPLCMHKLRSVAVNDLFKFYIGMNSTGVQGTIFIGS